MTKYIIIAAALILFQVYVNSNYATTREKEEVVQVFDPIMMIILFISFVINIYLGYSLYAASEIMQVSNTQEIYRQAPFLIGLVAILPFMNVKGEGSFIYGITLAVWIICFFLLIGTFLLFCGFPILGLALSIITFNSYSLVEEFAKAGAMPDDIFYQIFCFAYVTLIILSGITLIRWLSIFFFADDSEEADSRLIFSIGYLTGLLFVVAAICYIKGEIIWNRSYSAPSKRSNSPYFSYDEAGEVVGEGGGKAGAKARTAARKAMARASRR
jgi:hypothetical protein